MAISLSCPDEDIHRTFTDELITVGRGPGNTVRLANAQVSSVHGQLLLRDGTYWFQDLGSTNGSMVRLGEQDWALDGRTRSEAQVPDGAVLILGDLRAPVVITCRLVEAAEEALEDVERTIVATRRLGDLSALSVAVLGAPGTERARLEALVGWMERLQERLETASIAARVVDFLFETLPMATVAGLYVASERGLVPVLLRTRSSTEPLPIPWRRVAPLFKEAFEEASLVQVEDDKAVAQRFEQAAPELRAAVACPLASAPRSEKGDDSPVAEVPGLLVVAGPGRFLEDDLDWCSLVAYQAGLTLRNAGLVAELARYKSKLEDENAFLKQSLDKSGHGAAVDIVGTSPALARVLRQVEIVARTDTTVLVLGETGTGKELVARMLHNRSSRANGLFAAVNCGALTETLLESELFGHVRGAFTGASRDKKGLFEVADRGTLFLDEFGDVSPRLQVKMLRVLENGEVTPVGSVTTRTVDVRIVAATNKDLRVEVEAGRLREDLFYRINVFPVQLPPLRERVGDVHMLVEHFIKVFAERFSKEIDGVTLEAMQMLERYAWPGNVRELQNELERAVLLAEPGAALRIEDLSDRIGGVVELPVKLGPLHETMAELEGRYIRRALMQHDLNRTRTAKTLGISRQALTAKLHKYALIDLK